MFFSDTNIRHVFFLGGGGCSEGPSPGIYVFHTWNFCAGRKTSTIGLFELFITIICWIFCAYTQILSRDVEDFCVHAQKFLMKISDNKVFQSWIICAYTQILNINVEVFAYVRRNS